MATILVVDDRPVNREYLVTLLGYSGHRLHEAAGGAEALAMTREVHPDLVIADILMPLMDGYELVRLLRADPAIAAVPVIFYTAAYLEREARALAQKCGVTNLLTMPIEPREMLVTVDEVLGQSQAPAAAEPSDEIDRQHLRLLTDTLVAKVGELEAEIVERRRAETTARESEERFRQLAENIREVFWLLDLESDRLLFVSSAYATIWGRPLSDLDAGRGAWVEGIHPLDRDRILEATRTKAVRGEYSEEYRIIRPDGTERWIRDRAFPVQVEPGRGSRIAGIAEDVTERKQTEQAAHDRAARLRAVVETAGDGIITIDAQGRIDSFNPAAKKMFGYSTQEVIGQNVNLLMPAPYREHHDGYLSHYLSTGEKKIISGGAREVVGKRKDGSTFPLELTVTEMSVSGNRMFTGMLRDITERKLAHTLLELRADELARSNAELEQFAYVASHDLQEPLRMVASYLGLLAERYVDQLDDRADKYINYAVDGAVRMKAMIDDLLSLSRVTTEGKPLVVMEAQAALDEALVNLSTTIRERGAIVTCDNLPQVLADPIQMVRLFQNLIGNAIKFCEDKQPTVHIRAERVREEWVLSVRDNGIGIAPQHRERIFQIFKRLHHRDKYTGTGIGLAICKKVVERHSGRIWVESQPDEGSTFFFTMPVKTHQ